MASNQNIEKAIANLNSLLKQAKGQGELKSFLKSEYKMFVSHWNQCAQMTRLKDYNTLAAQIHEITHDENTWFYIGYTGELGYYLWDKIPDNKKFRQQHNLVKSHTYYTHLQGNEGENEDALIKYFVDHERCLNVRGHGNKSDDIGIVYVLFFNPGN